MPDTGKASQAETLAEFRKQLFAEDILHEGDTVGTDDETLLRFLRARKFDLKQSKKMFADCQHWRKTVEGVGIDELYRQIDPWDYPERKAVFDCWPLWFHQTDKLGRPLNIQFFTNLDLPKLYKTCTPEKHWQSVLVNSESLTREVLPACSRKAGKNISTVLVIIDLKGFGLSQFWQMKSLARSSFQMSQDYYPETMGKVAIVNAPSSFSFIWSVMRPWIAKETADKIEVLGHDYQKVLLDLVDEENLPSVLGGKCTCSDKGGCHFSGVGPWQDGRKGWGPKAKAREAEETANVEAKTEEGEKEKSEENAGEKEKAKESLNNDVEGQEHVENGVEASEQAVELVVNGAEKQPEAGEPVANGIEVK